MFLGSVFVRNASADEVGAALEQWWLSTQGLLLGKRRSVEGRVHATHIIEALLNKTVPHEVLQVLSWQKVSLPSFAEVLMERCAVWLSVLLRCLPSSLWVVHCNKEFVSL